MQIMSTSSPALAPTRQVAPPPAPVEVANVATSQDLADIGGVRQGDYDFIGYGLSAMIYGGGGAAVGGVGGAVAGAYLGAHGGAVVGAAGALVGGVAGVVVGGVLGATYGWNHAKNQ